MMEYSEQTGRSRRVVLEPEIVRAYWSRRRAWQDEEVKLHVETRFVKDGTKVELQVWEDGADESAPDQLVAKVPGNHVVRNGRCEATYKIKWDRSSLGKELKLQRDEWEFYFLALIEKPALKGKSGLLYVDLDRLVPSL